MSLRPPFKANNHLSLANKIINSDVERIPMRYSEDLQEVILWMLSKEPSERPSVSDLLAIPKIQLRINERKMKDDYEALKRREEEVYSKYKKLREREKALVERENALTKRTEDAQ